MMKKKDGFTLVELLVVIAIIVMLVAMSIPAMSGYMKQRRLKAAAWAVQMSIMETRSRAIAQREVQHLVFFIDNVNYTLKDKNGNTAKDAANADIVKTGALNTIYSYDSNESTTTKADDYLQVGDPVELPQFITYAKETNINTAIESGISTNVQYDIFPDGTIVLPDDRDGDAKNYDMVFTEKGLPLKCYLDVMPTTGRVSFVIKEVITED